MPPSDAYVRSFPYLLYTLVKLLHKSSERSSLVSSPGLNSSPPEAKNPTSNHSATTFQSSVWAGAGRAGCLVWFPQKQTLRQSSVILSNTSWKLGSEARKGESLG